MSPSREGPTTDPEITVKPQFLRFQPKLRVAEDDVIWVVSRHALMTLTQGWVRLPLSCIEEKTAARLLDVMLTDGEFRESAHGIPIGQSDDHHQIGPFIDVVMEIDFIGLVLAESIDDPRCHTIAVHLLTQLPQKP